MRRWAWLLLCCVPAAYGGDELVLIMDAGRAADPYLSAALEYHGRAGASIARGLGTIQAASEAMAARAAALGRPLDSVRLVVHGSEWTGLAVPVTDGGELASAEVLAAAALAPPFPALGAEVIGRTTRITVDACGLGRRPRILHDLAVLFAGTRPDRPMVSAASGFVHYRTTPAPRREERSYRAEVVQGADGSADHHYPVRVAVAVPDPEALARLGLRRWLALQSPIQARLASMGLTVDQLHWQATGEQVIGTGQVLVWFTAPDPAR